MARRLKIRARLKERPINSTTSDSFAVEDAGAIPTEELLHSPIWSLCCFDFRNGQAIFVQTPEGVDLTVPAFYYMAQYENAIGLASIPLAEFERIADSLPWAERITFVPSTGRCGSTLLSRVFATVPGTLSISESDDLGQINNEHLRGNLDETTARRLVYASIKWRGAQIQNGQRVTCLVTKPRSEVTLLARVFQEAVPHSKNIFMYRGAEGWIRSAYNMYRVAVDMDDPEVIKSILKYWAFYHPLVNDYMDQMGPLQPAQALALNWCHFMETYLDLYHEGLPYRAVRYEDLVAQPRSALRQVFEFVGLEIPDWEAILAIFDRDAQEGSPLSREQLGQVGKVLPDEALTSAKEIIGTRPRLQGPNTILPGTLNGI